MTIMDRWRENRAAVEQIGQLALEAARKSGAAVYYTDPLLGPGIVKEMPDGSRYLVELRGTEETVVRSVERRG